MQGQYFSTDENFQLILLKPSVERSIKSTILPKEESCLSAIADLVGNDVLTAKELARFKKLIYDQDNAFILPAGGVTTGDKGGLTAHIYNMRFGPCALRVQTKTKEELQLQLYELRDLLNGGIRRSDKALNKICALQQICHSVGVCGGELGGDGSLEAAELEKIKNWQSHHDVLIPSDVAQYLGKVWVYLGNGESCLTDRVFVRECLKKWTLKQSRAQLEGFDKGEVRMDDTVLKKLAFALEPFDLWLPCSVLDQYCCLTDIPGKIKKARFLNDKTNVHLYRLFGWQPIEFSHNV